MSVTESSETETTESSEAERAEQRLDAGAGASDTRVPTWVSVVLGALGLALVVVTLGLLVEARDASTNAEAASAAASQLFDDLVADVKTTNDELSTFNEQFESAVTSAQETAAQAKQKRSERSSSNDGAHDGARAPRRAEPDDVSEAGEGETLAESPTTQPRAEAEPDAAVSRRRPTLRGAGRRVCRSSKRHRRRRRPLGVGHRRPPGRGSRSRSWHCWSRQA